MGYHYWTNKYSIDDNYDTAYTFFRKRRSRPKVEISPARRADLIGFKVKLQRNGIHNPHVVCNGISYPIERQDRNSETVYLQENTDYWFYPFAINQDPNKGAYIVQWDSRHREINQFDTTPIQVPIRIRGEGFKEEKDCNLESNLVDLREKRLNPNETIRPEDITFSLKEIKKPSRWSKLKSSFSVSRTPIPK